MASKKAKGATKTKTALTLLWQTQLQEYVTAIAWCPTGDRLAASSAAGEVVIYSLRGGERTVLQTEQGESVDALAISADGRFLAAGGQSGTVWIWQLQGGDISLITTLPHKRTWIDCLRWHPHLPLLALGLGRYAQVWDAAAQTVITTLSFDASSVLDIDWHPEGQQLSLGGNQSIKTWQVSDWDDDPEVREIGGASGAIAWSPDGIYLASGNNDRSVMVWPQDDDPWRMTGFPGKVRELAWSRPINGGAPILASVCGEGIVVWRKAAESSEGWKPRVLDPHEGTVRGVAFQSGSLLLATAAEDGRLCLWSKAARLGQVLTGTADGFSCLSWSPDGTNLAAGGSQGEVLVWAAGKAGQGFG
ncbi:MAG: WD40 repeat domain-containing protein [Cyanobacteria bacterium J06632_22]